MGLAGAGLAGLPPAGVAGAGAGLTGLAGLAGLQRCRVAKAAGNTASHPGHTAILGFWRFIFSFHYLRHEQWPFEKSRIVI